jgi:hypothetical protein
VPKDAVNSHGGEGAIVPDIKDNLPVPGPVPVKQQEQPPVPGAALNNAEPNKVKAEQNARAAEDGQKNQKPAEVIMNQEKVEVLKPGQVKLMFMNLL